MIKMRLYSALLIIATLFTSCDDGDIIVTTFEFEEDTFNMCSDQRNKVLYHINNDNVFETLSVQISDPAFSVENNQLIRGLESLSLPLANINLAAIRIQLTESNGVIYRTYDGTIPSDYFCRDIPPSSPKVLQEYKSVGGEIVINTGITFISGSQGLDHDGDGIPSNLEGMDSLQDTDGDGIPDYLDIDDDGDNVLTSRERQESTSQNPTTDGYTDTDEDGVPNYLDPDDDGDGVLTIRERSETDPDPTINFNEAGTMPAFLDQFTTRSYSGEVSAIRPNNINVRYASVVEAQNLKLKNQGGDGEEISFVSKTLGIFNSRNISLLVTPDNTEEESPEEEEENNEETDQE